MKDGTMTISKTGGQPWNYSFLLDSATSTYKFKLYVSTALVLTYDCGSGVGDPNSVTVKTLADLKTAIEGVSTFTVSYSGVSSSSIATVFPLTEYLSESTTASRTIPINYWEAVSSYIDLNSYYNLKDTPTFRPPIFTTKNNVVYITCGGEMPLLKYDGRILDGAGLPGVIKEGIEMTTSARGIS